MGWGLGVHRRLILDSNMSSSASAAWHPQREIEIVNVLRWSDPVTAVTAEE